MEVFEGNYKVYQTVMCYAGLWPYDNSISTRIHRVAYALLLLGCMVSQLTTMKNRKISLNEIIMLLSFGAQLLIYFIRYFSSILTFATTKKMLDNMQNDFAVLNDPNEVKMLLKDSILAKRILMLYIALSCTGSLCVIGTLGISTFLNSDIQLRFLYLLGFFYNEKNVKTDFICWHIIFSMMHGLLTLICSEGTITVFASHMSGMLEIARHRMRAAIDDAATSTLLKKMNIKPAVEMHRRVINYSIQYADDVMIPSFLILLAVVVSFAINIYRLYMCITGPQEIDALILSVQFVVAYTAVISGNNYSGQLIVDNSISLMEDIYNSLWYRMPVKMQKMLLFALMKSQSRVEFNLAGLFVPCFEGLQLMFSSSFSYFTLLCSFE